MAFGKAVRRNRRPFFYWLASPSFTFCYGRSRKIIEERLRRGLRHPKQSSVGTKIVCLGSLTYSFLDHGRVDKPDSCFISMSSFLTHSKQYTLLA